MHATSLPVSQLVLSVIERTGSVHSERITYHVIQDYHLKGCYLIKMISEEAMGDILFHFPDCYVAKGDVVHVVTGHGKPITIVNEQRGKVYVFFTGAEVCHWNELTNAPRLLGQTMQ